MNQHLRKQRERDLLAQFLRKEKIEAQVHDSESPDFLLTLGCRVVGLEVTELHHSAMHPSSSLQAREAMAKRVVSEAQRVFAEKGGPSLKVVANFSPSLTPGEVQRTALARSLCELIEGHLPALGEVKEWRPSSFDDRGGDPSISYLHMYHQPQSMRPHWIHMEAGWVAPLTLELVQSAIDRKVERLPAYRLRTSEVWLLLAVGGMTPSQFFDTELQFTPSEIRSSFDRTYLSDAFLSRAILLGLPDGAERIASSQPAA